MRILRRLCHNSNGMMRTRLDFYCSDREIVSGMRILRYLYDDELSVMILLHNTSDYKGKSETNVTSGKDRI